MNLELFEQLGVLQDVENIGLLKPGVELHSPDYSDPVTLSFSDAWDDSYSFAYQIRRPEFDKVLFDNCVRDGVRAMQSCRVSNVVFGDKERVSVTTTGADGTTTWNARLLVDASGRDTFLGNRLSLKRKNRRHTTAAIFGHFEGAQRLEGES